MNERIDLFKLHDSRNDFLLRNYVMAKGIELKSELANLLCHFNKTDLVKTLMRRFCISIASAERLVYLKRDWFPLCYIEFLLQLSNKMNLKYEIQDKIEYLKANQPPERIYKAVKFLSPKLCKLIGAHTADGTLAKGGLIRITDGYEKNIDVLKSWVDSLFDINAKKIKIKKSSCEYGVEFRSKIIGRYLNRIFDFPYGCKQYTTREPAIIKDSTLENRKAFALGALTFEAGVGIKHQIELCVVSKNFRDDISEILNLSDVKHACQIKKSGGYWRLWSRTLTKEQASTWMNFFAKETEKWFLLKNCVEGFQRPVTSFEEASHILAETYPTKSASKVCLQDILEIIKETDEVYRYQLVKLLCEKKNIDSYGGKWAHSLKHYLDILKMANIISVEKRKFGRKKSWGSIVREVYIFNNDISEWRMPVVSV